MSKVKFSRRKLKAYLSDAETVKFLRNHPVIACEQLLNIKLTDSQKLILMKSWNKQYICLNCSRNFGKSFLIAIIVMLKAMLYPNQSIYIVSNSGAQAQETFGKMEDIAKASINSIDFEDSITGKIVDIFLNELTKNNNNSDGFVHDKSSFKVTLFNGSTIKTLNSIPKNIRGKRATLLCIDESAFCSDEFITAVLPFLTQDSNFKTSTKEGFNIKTKRIEVPNQVIYASSAGDWDSKHAQVYKDFAYKMIAGDRRYYVADMPCDIPLNPYIDGKPTIPYLTQEAIDNEMRVNPMKAMREYYNKFQADGGEDQMIKWSSIRKNETLYLPIMSYNKKYIHIILAFDPAHTRDNSIIGAMGIYKNENDEYEGDILNFMNLIDLGKKKKMQMKSPDQIKHLRQAMLDYNGEVKDYANIGGLLIDAGTGGGGISTYADNLLEDWICKDGIKHKGMIDPNHERYEDEVNNYPNAWNKLRLMEPTKWRMTMCDNLIDNVLADAIKFPREYNGRGYVAIASEVEGDKESEKIEKVNLSIEEEISLINIDALKSETTSIHGYKDSVGNIVRYALSKDKTNTMHDDRFYVLLMLSQHLAELRRDDLLKKSRKKKKIDLSSFKSCASKVSF